MNYSAKKEKLLNLAAVFILLSMILMVLVIPGIYNDTKTSEPNIGGTIGVGLAALLRLGLWFATIRLIKKDKTEGGRRKNKDYFTVIVVLLIIFGLIYSDGAASFNHPDHKSYISNLMFGSVICDSMAVFSILWAILLKEKKSF